MIKMKTEATLLSRMPVVERDDSSYLTEDFNFRDSCLSTIERKRTKTKIQSLGVMKK